VRENRQELTRPWEAARVPGRRVALDPAVRSHSYVFHTQPAAEHLEAIREWAEVSPQVLVGYALACRPTGREPRHAKAYPARPYARMDGVPGQPLTGEAPARYRTACAARDGCPGCGLPRGALDVEPRPRRLLRPQPRPGRLHPRSGTPFEGVGGTV